MHSSIPFALSFPLQESQMIEASAGTGKTFTIATLYLRLVLGHGSEKTKFRRPLLPPEILVMTFTEAATQELRDRIRLRLSEAARYFRNDLEKPDEMLISLRHDYLEMEWPNCAQTLEIAAQWMDEAAVSTIHSWCQRMLREHAFDSGNLFQQQLKTDQSDLLTEVIQDYWRIFCYPLSGIALDWVRSHWGSPSHLQSQLIDLLSATAVLPNIDQDPAQFLVQQLTEKKQLLNELKKPWVIWSDELRVLCDALVANKQVYGNKFRRNHYEAWCNTLKTWALDETLVELDLKAGFSRLTEAGLEEVWRQGDIPQHPALKAMTQLPDQLKQLPDPKLDMLAHATHWVSQRFEQQKIHRAEMGFDDLLTRLDKALHSHSGKRLAKLIRQQFPAAMVDEFQDTDPIQYRILSKIYLETEDEVGLFLIGDPKQAIYAFRGADIYTYLTARHQIEKRLHQLDTNYRSSQAMVEATNHIFNQAEQTNSAGAFLFKTDINNPLPFYPVKAQGRAEIFEVTGQPQTALTLWYQPTDTPLSTSEYLDHYAQACATEIVRLLNLGQQNKAGFRHSKSYLQPLRPADIAILVRSGREAKAIREALAYRNVRSVYLSDKDSVLKTQEAQDLLLWLEACGQPHNEHLIKTALATATLDLPLSELDSYNQHENIWEERILQFRSYKELWQKQGVLPMLRRLLQDFKLPQKLLTNTQSGERILTNLLHLTELLQQASSELDGEQALIRHLAERLQEDNKQADEYIVRLESDEQLVKVITIHKSKGLEYPLVFLPFICSFRAVDGRFVPIRYHDEHNQPKLSLYRTKEAIEKADQERLAEDIRLFYVALTRAKYGCYLGISDLKLGSSKQSTLHRSAIGYLFNNSQLITSSDQLTHCIMQLVKDCTSIQLTTLPSSNQLLFIEQAIPHNTLPAAREMGRKLSRNWWISSYSSLLIAAEQQSESPADTEISQVLSETDLVFSSSVVNSSDSIHSFPKGAIPGTFLHHLLDWAAKKGFAAVIANPEESRDFIARRCNIRGWEYWIDTLQHWLQHFIQLPLPLSSNRAALADLTTYRPEMEFMFACHWLDLNKLDTITQDYILPNQPRASLEAGKLNGMLKGFIDLTFEYEGRYYLADYKSNWLGEQDQAYTCTALGQAMLTHRYDLQLILYQLALHRQLKARLPNYCYNTHIGGVFYLFLRGYKSETQGIFHQTLPFECIDQLDRLFSAKIEEENQ